MKKLLKVLAGLIGVIVVLGIAAAIIIPMTVDPNDYTDEIVAAVKRSTGRDMRIEGQIELSVFPWLGVTTGVVELGNAKGFDGDVFARTDKISVRVKLMPLLKREVVMDTVTVHGLALNLARDKRGVTNWDDLVKGGEQPKSEGPELAALAIGGLDIRDASLTWRDAQTGQQFKISALDAKTGALAPGKPVDLDVAFNVAGGPPRVTGRVGLRARLDMNRDSGAVSAKGLVLDVDLSGDELPGGKTSMHLAADIAADLAGGSIDVTDLALNVAGLDAKGALAVRNSSKEPRFDGQIAISELNLKSVLEGLGQAVPQTADAGALTRVRLSAKLSGTRAGLKLDPLDIQLDDTQIHGKLRVAPPMSAGFDISIDAIDADRYLPPKTAPAPATATPGAAAAGAAELPLDTLRALDMDGQLRIGKLELANLKISDIRVTLKASGGLITVAPIAAKLYEGTYAGNIRLDARAEQPSIALDEKLAGIQAGPLLADLQGEDRLSGTGNVQAKLSARGSDVDAMKKTLNGTAAFSFTDGAIKGVNIAGMIRDAKAKLSGRAAAAAQGPKQTDFSELGGSIKIRNGVATNRDLLAKSPLLRIVGKGEANIPAESIDYRIKTTIVATTQGQGGADLKELAGIPIPIHVTGTFAQPSYGLDMEALAGAVAKSKAAGLLEGGTKGLGGGLLPGSGGAAGNATKKAGEVLEGAGKKAGNLLKGLFN